MVRVKTMNLEIVWARLVSLADEIATSLIRTAFSHDVIEVHDIGVAVFDARGYMMAQTNLGTPGHTGAMSPVMKSLLQRFPPDEIRPGDVFITNDPYIQSGHTPDVFIMTPAFRGSQLLGFAVTAVHHLDVGGRAGSALAEEIYEEGLIVPLLRLYKEGQPTEEIFQLFERNFRFSEKVLGDLRAQIGASNLGARRLVELVEEQNLSSLKEVTDEIVMRTEASMRAGIAALPDGTYHYETPIEMFNERDEPLRLALKVTIKDDEMRADFGGSSPQVRRPINSPLIFTQTYVMVPTKLVVDPYTPNNEGAWRPLTTVAPEGTIVNPRFPAPVYWRLVVGHMVADAMFQILAQIAPDKVPAGSGSLPTWQFYTSGVRRSGAPFMLHSHAFGGMGARPGKDGLAAVSFPYNLRDVCVEEAEAETPHLFEKREIICDGGGVGQWRGGPGEEVIIRTVAKEEVDAAQPITFVGGGGRFIYPPAGLFGGGPGRKSEILVNGVPSEAWKVSGAPEIHLSSSDVLTLRLPGGGGYGDPLQRERQLVAWDLKNGYISKESALRDYSYDPDNA